MLKDRAWIAMRIPHQGAMCLLDEVLAWNERELRCLSRSHRSMEHPLRAHGCLGVAAGIEIAAQCMAVHGTLTACAPDAATLTATARSATPSAGYLAGLRAVTFYVERLDLIVEDLIATVQCRGSNAMMAVYDFSLTGGTRLLVAGRATIVSSTPVRSSSVRSAT